MSAMMRPEFGRTSPRAVHAAYEAEIDARCEGILAERARIAGELHDTLLQGFTGIVLQLESMRNKLASSSDATTLTRILSQAHDTLRETRQMVCDMRVPDQEAKDLGYVLQETVSAMTHGAVELRCVVKGAKRPLSPVAEATLLRVGREAVANAVKHAGARTVDVELTYDADTVRLAVRDDGRGANCTQLECADVRGHWGVFGMRERAKRAGASLHIRSAPGEGTHVSLSLPTGRDPAVFPIVA
jgi:signal transduction histidine kinase